MKKILLSVVCLVMAGMQSMKAQTPAAIMLMHQGKATMYSNQELTNAVAAAEAGDTIFLSNGTYSVQNLTIDKPIALIGAGQTTTVNGTVIIDIDSTMTILSRLFDAIYFTGNVDIQNSPDGVNIRKCRVQNVLDLSSTSGNIFLDRCFIRTFNHNGFSKHFDAQNSVFYQLTRNTNTSYTGVISFTNCNIASLGTDGIIAYFTNCIVKNNTSNNSEYNNCVVNSTLQGQYGNPVYGGSFNNCWVDETGSSSTEDNSGFPVFNTTRFYEYGYIGTDGTIVSADGGSTPYNLTPSLPTISQSSFSVDNSTRTLNVTLTVTAE